MRGLSIVLLFLISGCSKGTPSCDAPEVKDWIRSSDFYTFIIREAQNEHYDGMIRRGVVEDPGFNNVEAKISDQKAVVADEQATCRRKFGFMVSFGACSAAITKGSLGLLSGDARGGGFYQAGNYYLTVMKPDIDRLAELEKNYKEASKRKIDEIRAADEAQFEKVKPTAQLDLSDVITKDVKDKEKSATCAATVKLTIPAYSTASLRINYNVSRTSDGKVFIESDQKIEE